MISTSQTQRLFGGRTCQTRFARLNQLDCFEGVPVRLASFVEHLTVWWTHPPEILINAKWFNLCMNSYMEVLTHAINPVIVAHSFDSSHPETRLGVTGHHQGHRGPGRASERCQGKGCVWGLTWLAASDNL